MRILFWGTRDAVEGRAGEANYVRHLIEGLSQRGVEAESSHDWRADLRKYEVVHFSSVDRICEAEFRVAAARQAGIRVIFTPVYVNHEAWVREGRVGVAGALTGLLPFGLLQRARALLEAATVARALGGTAARAASRSVWRRQRELLTEVDLLWINSHLEADALRERFGLISPYRVIRFGTVSPVEFARHRVADGERTYDVAVVGYLAPVKNQINVIRALRHLDIRGVLVGSVGRRHRAYGRRVLREARDAHWEIRNSVDRSELLSILARTRVVVQASWFETCGMTALEGLGLGCQAVVTARGFGREYFGDLVQYVEPDDLPAIRGATSRALQLGRSPDEGRHARAAFSWDHSVEVAAASLAGLTTR